MTFLSETRRYYRALIVEAHGRQILLSGERALQEKFVQQSTSLCVTLNNDRSINDIAREAHCTLSRLDEPWQILWSDERSGLQAHVDKLLPCQRFNYFFGMQKLVDSYLYFDYCLELSSRCLNDCECFPNTWILPRENLQLHNYIKEHPNVTLVRKPLLSRENKESTYNTTSGSGLVPAASTNRLIVFHESDKFGTKQLGKPCVVQVYITNPFLIDGLKFSISYFVLITACGSQLRALVHKEGNVGFYNEQNVRQSHRIESINQLVEWFVQNGYDASAILSRADHAIAKTMVAINPYLTQEMKKRNITVKEVS